MLNREELIEEFIKANNLAEFHQEELPRDASKRRYFRLTLDDESYILMDCSPDYTSLLPFIKTTNFLLTNEFSVPQIFVTDEQNGLAVIEDFGQVSFNKFIDQNQDKEDELYFLAIDNLIALSKLEVADLDFS